MTHRPKKSRTAALAVVVAISAVAVVLEHKVVVPKAEALGETQPAMTRVGGLDLPGTMSIAFSSRAPFAYAHARAEGGVVATIDISSPKTPSVVGKVKTPAAGGGYMEDMTLGERKDGTAFVLVRENDGLRVVDVTVPRHPRLRGYIAFEEGGESHTWTCLGTECNVAYGTRVSLLHDLAHFQIVDLSNLDEPKIATKRESLVGTIHDWNQDRAAVLWSVGSDGIAAYDVTDPLRPTPLNGSDPRFGTRSASNEYNDWVQLHGSLRPNARRFEPYLGRDAASVDRGNVLLVSEEGNDLDCTDSFQTWYVPHLDVTKFTTGAGSITPIDSWSLRDADPSTRPVAAELCSVHWFDYHQAGFVVMATYGSGTRVLDVRDAHNIRQVAYYFDADKQAQQSYWVPERQNDGRTTGRATNLAYTADVGTVTAIASEQVTGGIDIFEVRLPGVKS